MNCPYCGSEIRIVPEQVTEDEKGIPVFHRKAYCDACGYKADLDEKAESTSEEPKEEAVKKVKAKYQFHKSDNNTNDKPNKTNPGEKDGKLQEESQSTRPKTVKTVYQFHTADRNGNAQNIDKQNQNKKTSGLSIAALILSLFGLTCIFGIIAAIVDLINGKKGDGKKHTLSYIAIVLGIISLIVVPVTMGMLNGSSGSESNETVVEETADATADSQEMNSDNKEESEADTIKAEGNASIPEELLNEAKENFSDEYKFILFSDLEKYDANLNGEKIYTIAIVQEVDSDAIKSRKSEGYMFQGFKTNIDYTDYLSEGDVVCVYGTVGEEQELFGMRWTEISDSAVIACGDACEEYAQDSSDESLEEYFYDPHPEDSEPTPSELSESEFKEKCETYSYEDILRNPDDHKREYATVSGTVSQTIQGVADLYTSVIIEDSNGNRWGCNVSYKEGDSRILEGDYITVYGILDGTVTSENLLGEQVVMPYISIYFYE